MHYAPLCLLIERKRRRLLHCTSRVERATLLREIRALSHRRLSYAEILSLGERPAAD